MLSSDDYDSDSDEELTPDDIKNLKIEENCAKIVKGSFQGKRLVNGFEISGTLGQGGFATVKKAKFIPTGKEYAIKKMRKSWLKRKREFSRRGGKMVMVTMLDKVMAGVKILEQLKHENIVRLHSVMDDRNDDALYLVLDFCARKQVMDWDSEVLRYKSSVFAPGALGGIEEGAVAHVLKGLLNGLNYLQSSNVAHRDIKPDNLLITSDWTVKIADFGVSKQIPEEEKGILTDTAGTYPFMCPQIAEGKNFNAFKADVWSAGITLFAILFSTVPYYHNIHAQLFTLILENPIVYPKKPSGDLQDLLEKILEKDEEKRPYACELLKHPWIAASLAKGFKGGPNVSTLDKKETKSKK
ncbi:hypothetical protein AAMO2058_000366600 [Amorphochlora amoebiformis]